MRRPLTVFLALLLLAGCTLGPRGALPSSAPTLVPASPSSTATPVASVPALPTPDTPITLQNTATAEPPPTATPSPDPTAVRPPDASAAREATAAELAQTTPPLRDDARLAVAFQGAEPVSATPAAPEGLEPGVTKTFTIRNVDSNTISKITAELMAVGEHAYFWFDLGPGSTRPEDGQLAAAVDLYDEIYGTLFEYFDGYDSGGGRAHIVHASPQALCDVADQCGLAGYFSSQDLLPAGINPQSNELPMFIMNARQYGTDNYFDVLAHETRHLLGAYFEEGEEDWMVEGGAMLAEDLVGYPEVPQFRGSLFLTNPDQQLNSWTDDNTAPYYGQGYLVNRFLYDHLGEALYQQFVIDPAAGLAAVDAVASANGLPLTGEQLWLDWLVSMAVHDDPAIPERYRWDGPELEPVTTTLVNSQPATFVTEVKQYGADYYELPSSGATRIEFAGVPIVALLGTDAPSGEHYWYAQRANGSNPRLTRAVDLRGVGEATLRYHVYADIEGGYDFAYVSVSTDDGRTWQPVVAQRMQGLSPADDPSDAALVDRFYSSREQEWFADEADLSQFAGREILLRFEMVTDLIQTWGGFAVDDIAIPEIDFFDDAESANSGWTAEGFTRATADLPQRWPLQLVVFDADGQPTVTPLAPDAEGRLSHTYTAIPGARRPLLIVAAAAPDTLTPAAYTLVITSQ